MHGTKAFYIVPAMKHYRCYKVHIQKTLAKRIADTITFLPYNITMPNQISKTAALEKIHDLIKLLKNYKSHHLVTTNHNDTLSALNQLSDILNTNTKSNLPLNSSATKPYIAKLLRVPTLNPISSPRVNKYL